MSGKLEEMSVAAFVDLTAPDAPALDDGSVSALFGSLSVAFTGMVAGLTVGKKKYVEVEARMHEVAAAAKVLKKGLIEEIDRNSDSFNEFMAAIAPPKNTDEEKAVWKAAMQNGLKSAAKVSRHVAEIATRIFPLAKTMVERGNTDAATDGLVTAMAARTAVIGTGLSVKTNPASIEDEDFVAEYSARVAVLEEQVIVAEREIFTFFELTRKV